MKRLPAIAGLLAMLLPIAQAASIEDVRELRFRVLLDGKEIGYHNYEIRDFLDGTEVKSDARFDVKFLFITAYRYRHEAVEQWAGNCLNEFAAKTEANGKKLAVSGARETRRFVLSGDSELTSLPECVSTFAYWDASFLSRRQLLNPQTGEYVTVTVQELGRQPLKVRGADVTARRYRLTAREIELDLWYSEADEWLALESAAKGGRTIRYELT